MKIEQKNIRQIQMVNRDGQSPKKQAMSRDEAQELRETLDPKSRLANEINRALVLNDGGIKELSNGLKINLTGQRVLGGGRKEELVSAMEAHEGMINSEKLMDALIDGINGLKEENISEGERALVVTFPEGTIGEIQDYLDEYCETEDGFKTWQEFKREVSETCGVGDVWIEFPDEGEYRGFKVGKLKTKARF